jgi:hypothetical protein
MQIYPLPQIVFKSWFVMNNHDKFNVSNSLIESSNHDDRKNSQQNGSESRDWIRNVYLDRNSLFPYNMIHIEDSKEVTQH